MGDGKSSSRLGDASRLNDCHEDMKVAQTHATSYAIGPLHNRISRSLLATTPSKNRTISYSRFHEQLQRAFRWSDHHLWIQRSRSQENVPCLDGSHCVRYCSRS